MPKIVVNDPDGSSRVVRDKPFDLERILQENIQRLPELIPIEDAIGQQVALLPIGMEVQVGSGAIDILMLDSEGVLTIVETKLAKNPESRREVIGQVLEYGAHISEWSLLDVEREAERFFRSGDAPSEHKNSTFKAAIERFLDAAGQEIKEPQELLNRIAENLHSGRLRLIVASDQLLEVALKTITFVNAYSSFEMYLLQVTCYVDGDGTSIYVPSLHGYTRKVQTHQPSPWTEDRFFSHLMADNDEVTISYVREVFERFSEWTHEPYWGSGSTFGSFNLLVNLGGSKLNVAQITSRGDLYVFFGNFYSKDMPDHAQRLAENLNKIPGVQFDDDRSHKFPPVPRSVLRDDTRRSQALDAIRNCVEGLAG